MGNVIVTHSSDASFGSDSWPLCVYFLKNPIVSGASGASGLLIFAAGFQARSHVDGTVVPASSVFINVTE